MDISNLFDSIIQIATTALSRASKTPHVVEVVCKFMINIHTLWTCKLNNDFGSNIYKSCIDSHIICSENFLTTLSSANDVSQFLLKCWALQIAMMKQSMLTAPDSGTSQLMHP